jgi:hypothetical protein
VQHRESKDDRYAPPVSKEKRYTERGTPADLNIRGAYFRTVFPASPEEWIPILLSDDLTGFFPNVSTYYTQDPTPLHDNPSSICVGSIGGSVGYATTLNLLDQTDSPNYGNPHVSGFYGFSYKTRWRSLPGLKTAFNSHPPYYDATKKHRGGSVSLILHLNRHDGRQSISLVIKAYSLNKYQGNTADAIRRFDPNNNRLHCTSHFSDNNAGRENKYFDTHRLSSHTQVSRYQQELDGPFEDYFHIELTREKIERLLREAEPFFGAPTLTPEHWGCSTVATHFELNDDFIGGKTENDTAMMSGAIANLRVWR